MKQEPNFRCEVCWYFVGSQFITKTKPNMANDDVKVGHCHRYPPKGKNWPLVMGNDICGEFLIDKNQIN